ncbi:MAG: translation initiation factor IF-2 subunit gamma [Candidatus Thalassarchaeum betae]|uniref:protein-synthesizing GTPase n=1 Tax=Candidatus Thalassarchaeum betae TaxID=2599289 RepID=A0A2V3HSC0_9ARCH|nr:MAG: translation initiation factor IF-2 subunit gamma [Candidatus Thalassoarchaea betae]HIC50269.1 translation initiation factor IF-2 subunit gamma [Candidatus Poseidoniales archaeon]HIM93068.1 translation initiation factor IF-2 subunit gamma [Candidatus Poseidoniales archaeon]
MVGHVDHGKTTLTQALSGVWTDTHSEERKRGISIKLGYADTAFYKTADGRFYAKGKHPDGKDDDEGELLRVVSFVDAPGHETLMAVMISGASIMDGAMLLIAATEKCPQSQTREHLAALQIAGIENIVVVQNKIDIVTRERAVESHGEIKGFLEGTIAEGAPIIPVSAHHDVNLDILIQAIEDSIPTPDRSLDEGGLMYVARSFDTNRPGSRPDKLQGGIIGGSIVAGSFSVGDSILIAPGRRVQGGGKTDWEPIRTTIESVRGGGLALESVHAGGLCGIATPMDPVSTKADELSGQVMAREGELPPVWEKLDLDLELLENMVSGGEGEPEKVRPLQPNEMLMVNSATATSVGTVSSIKGSKATLQLRLPICAKPGSRITLSRRVGSRWRLIGHGSIGG